MRRAMRSGCRRGSAMVLAIILAVIVSGLVMTMSWSAGVQANMTGNYLKEDQGYYAAEAGAAYVAWNCKNGLLDNFTSPYTGSLNGYTYTTSWTTVSGNAIRITSKGGVGNIAATVYETVTPPVMTAPVMSAGGDFNNKNLVVTGDVAIGGDYTNAGTGSISGDLTYAGTASNTGSVKGTVAKGTFKPMDFTTLDKTLVNAAGVTYSGAYKNKTFDFTGVAGANKVIYVDGDVTTPKFVGSGTLYVTGALKIGSFGTATAPVNIVVDGDVTSTANAAMLGSLYTNGGWARAKFKMTGLLYVQGDITNNGTGKSTLAQSATPWFDTRYSSGGQSGTTVFANFAGPSP